MLKRSTVNFIADTAGFILLLGLAATGVIMKYTLPPGSGGHGFRGGRGAAEVKTFLSMGRHQWGEVHFWLSVLFAVIIVVHIALHFKWIKAYIKSLGKR